jgi:ABC-2 type transport system ATP-binding protein
MIFDISKPTSGRITILGASTALAVRQRIGYLPEEKGLYKKMRVGELLVYFGRLKGLAKRTAGCRAVELLERFGLERRFRDRCESLSKGLSQKVQVLATLIHDPDLVVLDEPFSGLDPVNVEVVRNLIVEIAGAGKTVILSTHLMEQAEKICERIVLIHHGRKVLDGSLADIKRTNAYGVRVDYEGDDERLGEIPGLLGVERDGQWRQLHVEADADPQVILRALLDRVRVRRFDVREPSLHDIFVRAVEGTAEEGPPAPGAGAGEARPA